MPLVLCWSFFLPLLLAWLMICALIALFGVILPAQREYLNTDQVEASRTVCKILHKKGLITDEEYAFEHRVVAARYDHSTFKGYLFILTPIMGLLERSQFLDKFLTYLVKAWMDVQHHWMQKGDRPARWQIYLARVCVSLAHYNGRFVAPLFNLRPRDQSHE